MLSRPFQDLAAGKEESARLASRVKELEEASETLRAEVAAACGRCSEAELELAQVTRRAERVKRYQ